MVLLSRQTALYAGIFVVGLVTLPIIFLILGFAGAYPVDAVQEPPAWEVSLGQSFLRASLASKADGLIDPVDPKNVTQMMDGLKRFRSTCAGCHGDYGQPSKWGLIAPYPRVPQFAEKHPPLNVAQMWLAARHGIRYTGMAANPAPPGSTPAQIASGDFHVWEIVTFIDHMRDLPPAVDAEWKHPKPDSH
jgi:mono/diheme cytochrome c family protein